jgi:nicotinamide-nucleotide amidase
VSRPRAALLLTGAELLDGRTRDLNGRLFAETLSARGARVTHLLVAPDDAAVLADDLAFLLGARPELLVVSGGLGTTHDDLTTATIAGATGRTLVEHPAARDFVVVASRRVAERRGVALDGVLEHTLRQALLPRGATPLPPAGVAPGFMLTHAGTRIVALPGVPGEVRVMWPQVLDSLAAAGLFPEVVTRRVRTYGVGEIHVSPLIDAGPRDRLEVAITAGRGEVSVQVRYAAGDEEACRQAAGLVEALERGAPVFSSDGRSVDEVVADGLRATRATVAVAESCTGGTLGGRLTDAPGSSDYFRGGVIAYANEVKETLLGVPAGTLARYGAVSEEVAAAMAEGARDAVGATFGLATTGIAGPDGGSDEKPVGLVCTACAGPRTTRVECGVFPGDRATVRAWATTAALHLLRDALSP